MVPYVCRVLTIFVCTETPLTGSVTFAEFIFALNKLPYSGFKSWRSWSDVYTYRESSTYLIRTYLIWGNTFPPHLSWINCARHFNLENMEAKLLPLSLNHLRNNDSTRRKSEQLSISAKGFRLSNNVQGESEWQNVKHVVLNLTAGHLENHRTNTTRWWILFEKVSSSTVPRDVHVLSWPASSQVSQVSPMLPKCRWPRQYFTGRVHTCADMEPLGSFWVCLLTLWACFHPWSA